MTSINTRGLRINKVFSKNNIAILSLVFIYSFIFCTAIMIHWFSLVLDWHMRGIRGQLWLISLLLASRQLIVFKISSPSLQRLILFWEEIKKFKLFLQESQPSNHFIPLLCVQKCGVCQAAPERRRRAQQEGQLWQVRTHTSCTPVVFFAPGGGRHRWHSGPCRPLSLSLPTSGKLPLEQMIP